MPVKLTMEPLFSVRQLVGKYKEKKKNLCMMFTDSKKVYDSAEKSFKVSVDEKKILKNLY